MKTPFLSHLYDPSNGTFRENPDYVVGLKSTTRIQKLFPTRSENIVCMSTGTSHIPLTNPAYLFLSCVAKQCRFETLRHDVTRTTTRAIGMMLSREDLVAYPLSVTGSPSFPANSKRFRLYDADALETIRITHTLTATVYVIASKNIRRYVDDCILCMARGDYVHLNNPARLRERLFQSSFWVDPQKLFSHPFGWLELDNGFVFFSDQTQWRKWCFHFNIDPPPPEKMFIQTPDFTPVMRALKMCSKRKE